MLTELFEIELLICIKIDLRLYSLQWLIYHKTKSNKPFHQAVCDMMFHF